MSTLEVFLESREKDGVWLFNRRWRDCPFYGIYDDERGDDVWQSSSDFYLQNASSWVTLSRCDADD
ncbi:hypothetical protein [Marinobacter mangrovi]|uniref:hypothetical protein n=1 Tax=Marinobacter mangrovi TaxID=2803918 RepID=UPI0019316090|nr:hypothetical protein [Marinobacter mangrovi]